MGRLGLTLGLVLSCIVAWPSLAQAASILLVKPAGFDAATLETFNRLRGELHVHGFQVVLVESANQGRTEAPDLGALTELHGTQAGVYLVRGSKPASAEIWIAGRGNGGMRTILTSAEKDAPVLLAIRVVDLLRTNLHEPKEDNAATSGTKTVHPGLVAPEIPASGRVEKTDRALRPTGLVTAERAGNSPSSPGAQDAHPAVGAAKHTNPPVEKATPREPAAEQPAEGVPPPGIQDAPSSPVSSDETASAAPVTSPYRFSLSAGLAASFDYHLGVGLGPAVSAHYQAFERVGFSLGFVGPVFGLSYEDAKTTARVREEMLVALVTLSAWRHGRIAQNVFIGPGAMHVSVQGEAQPPLAGRGSSTWVGLAQVGTGISYQVLSRLSIELSASALLLVPQPTIDIAESRHPMGDPQFLSCFALHLGL